MQTEALITTHWVFSVLRPTGDDVPTSGSATYTGEASGGYVTSDGSSKQAIMGDMTASADFGAGTVDVTVSNLTGYDEATNSADTSADLLFDSASASMVLNSSYRNNFYNENSSDVTYSKNGSEVDISSFTGSDNTNSASGSFYGFDTTDGNPAEIGGSITSEGSDGQVIVNYVGAKTE